MAPTPNPSGYSGTLAAELPAAADDIRAIAALYAGLRYGNASAKSLAMLRQRVAAFRP